MTFTEYMNAAREGDKTAYGMLCNDSADGLYAIAYLTLNTAEDAEQAVQSAFSDGFCAINRIKDRRHLRAWLARELTKHIVDRLKQYRKVGEPSPEDTDAKRIFSQLSGLDRLVCALNLTYGYDSHEISIITGLSEDAVSRKLENSDKKLGAHKSAVSRCIIGCKAPESLYTKEKHRRAPLPPVHDEAAGVNSAPQEPSAEKADSVKEIDARMFISIISAQHITGSEFLQLIGNTRISNSAYREIEQNPNLTKERLIVLLEESSLTTDDYYKLLLAIRQRGELIDRKNAVSSDRDKLRQQDKISPAADMQTKPTAPPPAKPEQKPTEHIEQPRTSDLGVTAILGSLNKESAKPEQKPTERTEQPRTSDLGVTAILGSLNKESSKPEQKPTERIEQPHTSDLGVTAILGSLGKESAKPEQKPIEHIEQPRTSDLGVTAILGSLNKESAKPEQKPTEHIEQPRTSDLGVTAILGSLNKESAKPEQKPIEPIAEQRRTDGQSSAPIISSSEMGAEKKQSEKPLIFEAEASESAPKKNIAEQAPQPYSPKLEADAITLTEQSDKPTSDDEPVIPAKPKVLTPPVREAPSASADIREDEAPAREKYKSNEFFYNDDAYEPGINNGKIAFCAVCAVLLFAGSFGIRYMTTGSFLPTQSASATLEEPENITAVSPDEIITDADVKAAVNKLTLREQKNSLDEYYTGGAYESALSDSAKEIGDVVYLYSGSALRAVSLNEENPAVLGEAELTQSGKFIGFTANEKYVYALFASEKTDSEREKVIVEIYDGELSPISTYKQDGSYVDILADGEALTVFTSLNTFGEDNALPSYELDGNVCALTREDIEIPENIAYNSFSVFGTVSGTDARAHAVLGGYDSYVAAQGDSFTLLIPDFNRTYVLNYRIIGLNAELQSQEAFGGECFGKACMSASGDVFAAYDSAAGCTKIIKKINGEYSAVGSLGAGERLSGVSFAENLVYVVTTGEDGSATLYCGDTSGAALSEIIPDPDSVYSLRLSEYKDGLIGLSAAAGENGERTGLRLSVYGYDGKLSELYGTDITVDEKTAPEYVRYLSGDAEQNSSLIAVSDEYAAVSCVYFDGVSEIERFLCFKDNGESFEEAASIMLFDIQSDYRFLSIRNNTLYIITDSTIVTVDLESGNPTGYFPYRE